MATALQEKSFRTQLESDGESAAAQAVRDAYWEMFWPYAEPGVDEEDFDMVVDRMQFATGWPVSFVRKALLAFTRLQRLPRLRSLQRHTRLLNMEHLVAIDVELAELGPDAEQDVYDLFDDLLVDIFTPKRNNQALPKQNTVTKRIRELIKKIDPSRAYDKKKKEKRSTPAGNVLAFNEFHADGVLRSQIDLSTNAATSKLVRESLRSAAREHGITMADAAVKLLIGEIAAPGNVTMHIYAPKDRVEGDAVYIPGHGWTDPETTAEIERWLAGTPTKIVDLDEAAEQTLAGYVPSEQMRAAVVAKHRTCIYPGCQMPSERCQLDHRIPYEDGGPTTADNLFPLCQHHHNRKTDRLAFYFPDPHTGDIVWCFGDGTYLIVEPTGLLYDQITPTTPRWRSSLANVCANRDRAAEFNAKGHAILDEFETDQDLARAETRIRELEDEYNMVFEFRPEMPYQEPLPPEPDLEEPSFPDPEEYNPEPNPFHEKSFKPSSFVEWDIAKRLCADIMARVEEAA